MRRAVLVCALVALVSGVVLLVDLLGGPRLPRDFRLALPIVLAASLCAALVLGIGAFGAPRRPGERGS